MDSEGHDTVPPGYDTSSSAPKNGTEGGGGGTSSSSANRITGGSGGIRYRECLKNHALSISSHALDGCGEFMPAGDEGTLDALKCAACNCHRNFHRKETSAGVGGGGGSHHHRPQFPPNYYLPAPQPPVAYLQMTPPQHQQPRALLLPEGGRSYSREEEDVSNPSSSGGGGSGSGKNKRFRTKFSQEQKDKMLEFAERIGWRFQKSEEAAIAEFCAEAGIKRNVLKVWMHNNKITLGKKP